MIWSSSSCSINVHWAHFSLACSPLAHRSIHLAANVLHIKIWPETFVSLFRVGGGTVAQKELIIMPCNEDKGKKSKNATRRRQQKSQLQMHWAKWLKLPSRCGAFTLFPSLSLFWPFFSPIILFVIINLRLIMRAFNVADAKATFSAPHSAVITLIALASWLLGTRGAFQIIPRTRAEELSINAERFSPRNVSWLKIMRRLFSFEPMQLS